MNLSCRLTKLEQASIPIINEYQDLTREDFDLLREGRLWHRILGIYQNDIKSEDIEITDELAELLFRKVEEAVIEVQNLSDLEVIRETEEFWADHPTGTLRSEVRKSREWVGEGDKSKLIRTLAACHGSPIVNLVEIALKLREQMSKG